MHTARSLRRAFAASTITTLAAAACLAAAPSHAAGKGGLHYTIVDLGVVDATATASQAFGVSSNGKHVVGRDLDTAGYPAMSWTSATGSVALGNLAGRIFAQANGVNNAGTAVGVSTATAFGSGALPVKWVNGACTQLPLPAGQAVGRASSINDAGVAVGSIGSGTAEYGAIFTDAAATVITAQTATGRFMTYANAISDSGLVAGDGIDPNNAAVNVALVYDTATGTMTDIGALPGDNSALAFGISKNGYVVGASMMNQGSGMPFVWSPAGGMVAIPLPPATSQGSAAAVNDRGWVVGTAGGLYAVPFLYANGKTHPLYSLLPADSGWDFQTNTSSSAMGITDKGTIVGTAVHDGQAHAYAMVLVRAADQN